jgi:hypothetical protein
MTGPFLPAPASWMCAAVASMPVVLILPLTDLSDETTIVPLPDAAVLTGGTSWSPLSVTLIPSLVPAVVVEQPAETINAMAKTAANDGQNFKCTVFIDLPPSLIFLFLFLFAEIISTASIYFFNFVQQRFCGEKVFRAIAGADV